jgi:4-hydroxy-tetrahydrodipicolinate reductase
MKNNKDTVHAVIMGAMGHMGRVVAGLAKADERLEIVAGIDTREPTCDSERVDFPLYHALNELPEVPDVIIDFTHPSGLPGLLSYCKTANVPAVIATTGYNDDEIALIKAAATEIPVFYTFNLSVGINLMMALAAQAAKVLKGFDIEIVERHHNLKKDAPSGTALMLAQAMKESLDYTPHYVYDRHVVRKARENEEIGIHSLRGGTIVGEHEVVFAGHDEVLSITHSAASKEVFAAGALSAAKFIADKTAGLYTMNDLLQNS